MCLLTERNEWKYCLQYICQVVLYFIDVCVCARARVCVCVCVCYWDDDKSNGTGGGGGEIIYHHV